MIKIYLFHLKLIEILKYTWPFISWFQYLFLFYMHYFIWLLSREIEIFKMKIKY